MFKRLFKLKREDWQRRSRREAMAADEAWQMTKCQKCWVQMWKLEMHVSEGFAAALRRTGTSGDMIHINSLADP